MSGASVAFAMVVAQATGLGGGPAAVLTQDRRQPADEPVQIEDVVVHGRRGAALTPPEVELSDEDIDAFRAWDIAEALRRISESFGLGEQPLVLINGKRSANPSVFSGFPPEALARAEVLPPEAAALYGAEPGRRVVNLVLRPSFASFDGRLTASAPTQGGTSSGAADLRRSAIAGDRTHQAGFRVERQAALRAGDRSLSSEGAGTLESARVTLRPQVDTVSTSLGFTRPLGDWAGVFSLGAQRQEAETTVMLAGEFAGSLRRADSLSGSAGLSGSVAGWSIQSNASGRAAWNDDRGADPGRGVQHALNLTFNAGRQVFELRSGTVMLNLSGAMIDSRSSYRRQDQTWTSRFSSQEARGALVLPLIGPQSPHRLRFGAATATFGAGFRRGGGEGAEDLTAALDWSFGQKARLGLNFAAAGETVSDIQRHEPSYLGHPVTVFDFRSGTAVEVASLRGGNPDLRTPTFRRFGVTASAGPFTSYAATAGLAYQRQSVDDGVGLLTEVTQDVEAAFSGRIQRDPNGRLALIDLRPLNFGPAVAETLSANLNFRLPSPPDQSPSEAAIVRVALNGDVRLADTTALVRGLPDLDRLSGDGGGRSRLSLRLLVDAKKGRWGFNATTRWEGGFRTRRSSGRDSKADLVTAPHTAVDLRVSFQMQGAQSSGARRARGLQLNLELENLLDSRRRVELGDGRQAPGYGRDDLDPIGRTLRLSLQRRF